MKLKEKKELIYKETVEARRTKELEECTFAPNLVKNSPNRGRKVRKEEGLVDPSAPVEERVTSPIPEPELTAQTIPSSETPTLISPDEA